MTKQRLLTVGLIVLGLFIIALFGMRTLHALKNFHGRGPFGKPPTANQTDVELLRDWMTLPYIGKMYDVPVEVLFFSLGVEPKKGNARKSLKELNDEFFPNQPEMVLLQIKDTIKAFQSDERPPEPIPPADSNLPTQPTAP